MSTLHFLHDHGSHKKDDVVSLPFAVGKELVHKGHAVYAADAPVPAKAPVEALVEAPVVAPLADMASMDDMDDDEPGDPYDIEPPGHE